MEMIDLNKIQKKYLPPKQRPTLEDYSKGVSDVEPAYHRNPNTPTAEELANPIKVGAGTSYDSTPYLTVRDLSPNWLSIMKEEAAKGRGPTSFMRALGITKRGLETLLQTSPEFAEAFERCMLISAEWWEDRGRDMTEKGNGSVWLANMVNRWGWNSNKQETAATVAATSTTTINRELSKEELSEELERRGLSLKVIDESL